MYVVLCYLSVVLPCCTFDVRLSHAHAADSITHNLFACRGPCLAATDNFKNTQLWVVPAKGTDGLIRLAGTNQCLDAGSPPLVNGRILKTWTWYVSLSLSISIIAIKRTRVAPLPIWMYGGAC
jgi:hypothetical protein